LDNLVNEYAKNKSDKLKRQILDLYDELNEDEKGYSENAAFKHILTTIAQKMQLAGIELESTSVELGSTGAP
jgi:hypothetical protein